MPPPPEPAATPQDPPGWRKDPLSDLVQLLDRLAFDYHTYPDRDALSLRWIIANAPSNTLEPLWESSMSPFWMIRFVGHFTDREALLMTACECARTTLPLIPDGFNIAERCIAAAEADPLGKGDRRKLELMTREAWYTSMDLRRNRAASLAVSSPQDVLASVLDDDSAHVRINDTAAAIELVARAHAQKRDLAAADEIEPDADTITPVTAIVRRRLRCPTLGEVIDHARGYAHPAF